MDFSGEFVDKMLVKTINYLSRFRRESLAVWNIGYGNLGTIRKH